MKTIITRVLITVALVLSSLAIFSGLCAALFGSRADVSPREQSVCLWTGIGMILSGTAAFPSSIQRFRKTLLPGMVVVQVVLFLVMLRWGP